MKTSITGLLGLFLFALSHLHAQAQDTLTIDLGSRAKIIIYAKDRKGLELIRKLDLNQIVREVTAEVDTNSLPKSETKVYSYEYDPEARRLDLVEAIDIRQEIAQEIARDLNAQKYTYRPDSLHPKPRYKIRRSVRFWAIDLGLNTYLQNGNTLADNQPFALASPFESRYFGIGTYQRTRIGGDQSPFSVQIGIEANFYNFVFSGNNYVTMNDPAQPGQTANDVLWRNYRADYDRSLGKSKLMVSYFNMPLTFMLQFRNQAGQKTFRLGVGGYMSYRLGAYSKRKFDNRPERERNNFYLNNWRYGLETQLGYREFLMFLRYDLNPLFREGKAAEVNAFSFGVRI